MRRLPRGVNEMLDRVGDVAVRPHDAGLDQRPVQQLPRRPDECSACQVFLVARLLAHQH